MSITRSLLHANYSIISLEFLQINRTAINRLFIFIHVNMATTHTSAELLKTEVCVVNLLAAIFGNQSIKGF